MSDNFETPEAFSAEIQKWVKRFTGSSTPPRPSRSKWYRLMRHETPWLLPDVEEVIEACLESRGDSPETITAAQSQWVERWLSTPGLGLLPRVGDAQSTASDNRSVTTSNCSHVPLSVDELVEELLERRLTGRQPPLVVVDAGPVGQRVNGPASGKAPDYLASLVADGWLRIVVTTAVGPELDREFARFHMPDQYSRLVRGEHTDGHIAQALRHDTPVVKLLKLKGDTVGHSARRDVAVPTEIATALSAIADTLEVLWLGDPKGQIEHILPGFRGTLWLTGPDDTEVATEVDRDDYLRKVALGLARRDHESRQQATRLQVTEQISQDRAGDTTNSDRLVARLANTIIDKCDNFAEPTLLVYVHDPQAPGGSEVEKRIKRYLSPPGAKGPDSIRLEVRGSSIRWVDRKASTVPLSERAGRQYGRVIVVDSISFTGRTLELATQAIKKVMPRAEIFWAVLAASGQLERNLDNMSVDRQHLLRAVTSERHDIFFPWGWTQATSPIHRTVPVHNGDHNVTIAQRPWGTIEVLADQVECSVRILTVRAGERLSLQQHLLRDEFFIALDDYVGVEFESDDGEVVEAALLFRGDYLSIPRGAVHRFAAYRDSVRLLEIGFGVYDQTHDIRRFDDDYGRVDQLGDV